MVISKMYLELYKTDKQVHSIFICAKQTIKTGVCRRKESNFILSN